MGLFADFITNTTVVDKTEPQVGLDRIAYNELVGLQNRVDPTHPPQCEAKDEVQVMTKHVATVSGGNFTVTIVDELGVSHTTANILYNANAATIEGAIDTKMTADSYAGWTNGDISVALTGDLTANDATVTYDGASVTEKNFGLLVLTDVDLSGGGTVGVPTTTTNGQPIRYAWSLMWALGLYQTPPAYGVALDDQVTLWTSPGENPKWPSASLRRALAAQAAIDDGVPALRDQLEDLFNIKG
jgi:hypothetical protein